jgi:hypothetical protein
MCIIGIQHHCYAFGYMNARRRSVGIELDIVVGVVRLRHKGAR